MDYIGYEADSAVVMGRVIACLRKAAGLTQQDLSEKLRTGRAALAHLEVGRNTAPLHTHLLLARIFRKRKATVENWGMDQVFWLAVEALQDRGVKVRNGPLRPDSELAPLPVRVIDEFVQNALKEEREENRIP